MASRHPAQPAEGNPNLPASAVLPAINAFQKKHKLSDGAIGELALKDRGFVVRLREPGKVVRTSTANKLLDFLKSYVPPPENCPTCGNRLSLHQQAKFTACKVKPKQK